MTIYWVSVICFFVITNSDAQSSGTTDIPLIIPDPIIIRGLEWLENQREPDHGFQENTAKAVIAFQLANLSSWYNPDNLLSLLTVKEMDVEILLQLLRNIHRKAKVYGLLSQFKWLKRASATAIIRRFIPPLYFPVAQNLTSPGDFHLLFSTDKLLFNELKGIQSYRRHESPPNPSDIAFYCIALNSLCRDPRQFYGHDLISNINHQEMLLDLEFAISSLATCTSGTHVRKRQIRRLLDITEQNKEAGVETISMVALALHCIVTDHRNRNLHHYLIHPTKKLGKLQKEDGSFGDLKSSALAIQALEATDPSAHHWNKTTAIDFVRKRQNPNGSFGDDDVIQTTILVMLALGPQGLVKVKTINCHSDNSKDWFNHSTFITPVSFNKAPDNSSAISRKTIMSPELKMSNFSDWNKPDENSNEFVTVSYTLWVGSNVTEIYTTNITTDNNDTFYNVMQLAAQKNDHFSFLSTEWPNGHYVHTLAGYKEEPMSYHYWLLYKLPMPPDPKSPPPNQFVAPVGVDELLVEDGDHFLFWYKKL